MMPVKPTSMVIKDYSRTWRRHFGTLPKGEKLRKTVLVSISTTKDQRE